MLRLNQIKTRLSEARTRGRLEEFQHLWTDELGEHVIYRVAGEEGAVGYIVEHAPTRTPLDFEDDRLALLVIGKMLDAGVRVVDENRLDDFIRLHPRLSGFLAWFIDADQEGLHDQEVARSFVSIQDPQGDRATVAEGREVLAQTPFPADEVSRCAHSYFADADTCREWLARMLDLVEETVAARQEEIARSMKLWEGVHPLPDVWLERCAWCRNPGDTYFVVLYDENPEATEPRCEIVCQACAKAGLAYIHLRKQGVSRKQILRDFAIRV